MVATMHDPFAANRKVAHLRLTKGLTQGFRHRKWHHRKQVQAGITLGRLEVGIGASAELDDVQRLGDQHASWRKTPENDLVCGPLHIGQRRDGGR